MGKANFTDEFKLDAIQQITERDYSVADVSRRLGVSTHSLYSWMKQPFSHRASEDIRQTALIKDAWHDSGKVYGYRKLHDDLQDQGETCCPNRVARLAKLAGIKAQIGYKRRSGKYGGKPSIVIDNTLDRQFDVNTPDKVWVTDITYIKTYEGFSYLAVVIDLFSRRLVGWSMQSRQTTDLVLQAVDGRVATKAKRAGNDTLRSGLPVYKYGLGFIPKTA